MILCIIFAVMRGIPLVEKALSDGKHLTKEEIGNLLKGHKITNSQLLNLIMARAEMEGILCNGKVLGNKQTYTLLDGWVPRQPELCREEALERLARRYFTSHGPATITDFAWWSGLSVTDCRTAVGMIRHDFMCETLNGREFWMRNDIKTPPACMVSALLLPPFDEFVVNRLSNNKTLRVRYRRRRMSYDIDIIHAARQAIRDHIGKLEVLSEE